MKILLKYLVAILILLATAVKADVLAAITKVESRNNPKAVGDHGRAYGLLQIHRELVLDINRIHHTSFTHLDAFDPIKAQQMFSLYTSYYASLYSRRTGRAVTNEVIARIWNGGPEWFKTKRATDQYWSKVKLALNHK